MFSLLLLYRFKHLENTKPEIAEKNNNKNWIFAKLEAYEFCFVEVINVVGHVVVR